MGSHFGIRRQLKEWLKKIVYLGIKRDPGAEEGGRTLMPWAADFESAVSAYSTTSTNALQNCTGTAGTDGRLRAVRYIIIERRYIYARRCSNGRID